MTFEIDLNGRTRMVSVELRAAGRYSVAVDGRSYDVDAVRIGEFGLSLLMDGDDHRAQSAASLLQPGMSREVQVVPGTQRGEVLVGIDGRTVAATFNVRRSKRRGADGASSAKGDQAVVAPMPGRVIRVLVSAGDEVAARQSVVVVEAMKMENELRSPKAGRVKEVSVTPGTLVETGRVLVVIE